MAKHTDTSRSTDSGVSGNAQMGAREIRKWNEHDVPLSRPDGHNPYWCGGDMVGQCCFDDPCWSCISFLHEAAENAQKECSHLASRVEELEKALGDVLAMAVTEHDSTYVGGKDCEGCQAVGRAECVLAGEKEQSK